MEPHSPVPAESGSAPSRTAYDVLIVGSGHAGAQTAIALRQRKFEGSIALVGAEAELPYERPPLSKEYLSGEKSFDRILLRPAEFWRERNVAMHLGCEVVGVDPAASAVTLADARILSYGSLVWAAGGSPRPMTCAGSDLAGVHYVRSRADVDRVVEELPKIRRVAVIGGGYIGLEAAAALRKLGKDVVVLEALDRVLARVAGEPVSRFFEAEHRRHGTEVRTNIAVSCIEGANGRVVGVQLSDESFLAADLVVVGIGIDAAVQPLRDAGAAGANGVDVDDYCRTNLSNVYAIGDCAAHENRFAGGRRVRIESVQNANGQAQTAAKAILGQPEPYCDVPWFWSNQFDLKLQTVGLSVGYEELAVRGHAHDRSFSVGYWREGRIVALDCVNSVRDYVQGRALVEAASEVSRASFEDTSVPLKSLR